MSQLPPPNFGNFPSSFNVNGFPAWPTSQGSSPSIFGRPRAPLGFPPTLPINSFPCPPVSQFRPSIWPNMNCLPHHVVSQTSQNFSSPTRQQGPQVTNFQGKTNKTEENGQNSLKNEYSCDACQKEFSSRETMNAHLGSHVQCSSEGCTFKATRKMLKLHWIQVHATGKMKIKLDTPEEIAKWREERKRKYPSLANVEKRKEEEAKRRASGQVLKTKNFRYRRGQCGGRTFQRGGRNHFNDQNSWRRGQGDQNDKEAAKNQFQNSEKISGDRDCEETSQDQKRLQNGGDPLSFVLGESDDEEQFDNATETKKELLASSSPPNTGQGAAPSDAVPSQQVSALGTLCTAYASDSEGNEEIPAAGLNNNKETDPAQDKDKKPTYDSETRQNVENNTNIRSEVKQRRNNRSRRSHNKQKGKTNSKVNPKSVGVRKSTPLEKLLAPEIRHERNVILQCLRHIVKRNFFGIGDPASAIITD